MNESGGHVSSELLQSYLEGELATEHVGEVENHLAACRRCASEMDAWRLLFTELDEMPGLGPSVGFADRVMSEVPTRPSLARRLGRRIRSVAEAGAAGGGGHLAPERIQELLDGMLKGRRLRSVEAHLEGCAPCRESVREWEPIFATLASVPRLPAPEGFATRVMEEFRASSAASVVPAGTNRLTEWVEQAADWGGRLIPSTARGWAVLAAAVSLPTLGMLSVVAAVLAHPLLTVDGLVTFLRWRLGDGIQLGLAWLTEQMLQSPVLTWLWEATTSLAAAPGLALTALIALWAVSMAAGWVLYRNIIAPPPLADHNV